MKTKMIFNMTQADLFAKHGCKVVGVGLGRKNKIYLLFEVNETFVVMMDKWEKREFLK